MVRLKNRYLLVNILYPESRDFRSSKDIPDLVSFHQPTTDELTPNVLIKAIRAEVVALFGDYGSGAVAASLSIKYLSPATSTFILRVSRAQYRIAWAALSFMNVIPVKDGKGCIFRVVRVSGTVKKAEEEAIRRTRELMVRAKRELGDQSAAILNNILRKAEPSQEMNVDADIIMVDRSDSEGDEPSDGDG